MVPEKCYFELSEFLFGRGSSRGRSSRWPDNDRQQNRNRHYAGNDMKRARVIPGGLAHPCDVERPENAGKTPCREHKPINRPHIFWTKIIRREGWHCTESAAVTHQNDEGDRCHHRRQSDSWKQQKEGNQENEHDGEGGAPRDQIGNPRPKDQANPV